MRIIAGSRKGTRILAPKGIETRPTGDRVREAAFNLIGRRRRGRDRARPVRRLRRDGARGALPRGRAARSSSSPTATPAARSTRNLDKLRPRPAPSVLCQDALHAPSETTAAPAGATIWCSVDPPYRMFSSLQAAPRASTCPRRRARTACSSSRRPPATSPSCRSTRRTSRRYGSARLTLFERDE